MLKLLLILLVLCLSDSKLYQVVSVFRHGARYHLNSYYDGNSTLDQWGEITPVGMRQHQNFGKMLAKDYIQNLQFISPKYDKKQIEIFSTNYNRTIMSGLSHLYGLYPPGNGPQLQNAKPQYHLPPFNNKSDISEPIYAFPLGHQHIPIKFDDNLMLEQSMCPKMHSLWQDNFNKYSADYDEMNITYSPFMRKLISMFNLPSNANFQTVCDLFDTLVVDKYLGRPLPANFSQSDYQNLEHIYFWLNNMKYTNMAAKVLNSRKYTKIISEFQKRIQNLKGYALKWTFLSAHDTDILPMQTDLNLSSFGCVEDMYRKGKTDEINCQNTVPFAASLIYELHSDNDKDFYVMVRSQGKYMFLCGKQSNKCDWADFKTRLQKSIITNVDEVCKIKSQEKSQVNHINWRT